MGRTHTVGRANLRMQPTRRQCCYESHRLRVLRESCETSLIDIHSESYVSLIDIDSET